MDQGDALLAKGQLLMDDHPTLFWMPCAAHCIVLMLHDICKLPIITTTVKRAIALNGYIYNHPYVLNMIRTFTEQKELIQPRVTRFATVFLTLQSIYNQKNKLRRMFTSEEWSTSRYHRDTKGKDAYETVMSVGFWNNILYSLRATGPLVRVLHLVDSEKKPAMGYIYEAMDRAKEAISKSFNYNEAKYYEIWEIIDKRWNDQLHRPLHAAGYYLNPEYFYSTPRIESNEELNEGFLNTMARLVPDEAIQHLVETELSLYRYARGVMGSPNAIRNRALWSPVSQILSSSPDKNKYSKDIPNCQEINQDTLKYHLKKELVRINIEKEYRNSGLSKSKMSKQLFKLSAKGCKNQDLRKPSPCHATFTSSQDGAIKQPRKGEHPVKFLPPPEPSLDNGFHNSLICKNSACRAILRSDDTFCKRCSCCICHLFDDNKDPSLWLVCSSDSGEIDSCGLSCHIECALQRRKAGVVNVGQLMQLDGSYCCASCGKVSGIIESWKKQLVIAKDARRVDVLCYRIYLSHRLLNGTSRFKELHDVVEDAKTKLETEVGPLDGITLKMGRGIVSRLPIAGDMQKLCSLAIEKADAWLSTTSHTNPNHREVSLPAACRFQFADVTSSSLVLILREIPSTSADIILGYKLWYCKSCEQPLLQKEPICVFPRTDRRFLISNLQPCTEYTFRIISFTESGDLGHSEAKCFTKSVEIIQKTTYKSNDLTEYTSNKNKNLGAEGSSSSAKGETKSNGSCGFGVQDVKSNWSSGFRVRDLGTIIEIAWAQEEGCLDGFCSADVNGHWGGIGKKSEAVREDKPLPVSRELDLNVSTVPDLNAEVTPPLESFRDEEENGCTSERVIEAEDDINFGGIEKNGEVRSNGSGDSVTRVGEVPAVESRTQLCREQIPGINKEACDADNTINWPALLFTGRHNCLDGSYEHCVKTIRWLECEGHIGKDFREKFFTWFSLRATDQERRVVNTFIRTLEDDPGSLAGQLVDSFEEIISSKRPRNGFCSKLWH